MKIARKHQTIERKNSSNCIVTEYPIEDQTIDFAVVKINGRYPETRRATNLICQEIVYIQAGSGKVVVEDQEYSFNAGDVVLIEAGEKYFWEGTMELSISCRPAFQVEQHQYVD
ncbi:AraC family ligand binding domain-containing protein [Legionella cardiaca]|uniref:Cupin domain-containing protein n=1 Tax=Legionella cardiaca TaxID=1071983 RepID=A0ABY8AXL6_9GAMM|nr:AraC family ligand binding domain-containing protein [Legionella cardiaca]WED44476.1 cupin domain-containing protein [Legionella cardiaca]